jgi:alkanesulfonate monooxygenase SsuD/methylene tetrahydromethanopterin reductase-like flavin-dependent oxidoreductase (luciferase family)
MKALWTESRTSMKGAYWQFEDVAMKPEPCQKPNLPLCFGARQAPTLKRAVQYGDGWMGAGYSSTADFVQQYVLIQKYLDEARRDPVTFAISKRVSVYRQRPEPRRATSVGLVWCTLSQRRYGTACIDLGQSE